MQLEISDDEVEPSGRHPSISVAGTFGGSSGTAAAAVAGGEPSGTHTGGGGAVIGEPSCSRAPPTIADELDNLMDISIEIASNKRMKRDHLKPFKLTFKDKELEKRVRDSQASELSH